MKRKARGWAAPVSSDHWLEMMPEGCGAPRRSASKSKGDRREAAAWVRERYLGVRVLRDFANIAGGPFEAEVKDVWGNARTGQILFHLAYSDGDKEYVTWREMNRLIKSTAAIRGQRKSRRMQEHSDLGPQAASSSSATTQSRTRNSARKGMSNPPSENRTPPLKPEPRKTPVEPKTEKKPPARQAHSTSMRKSEAPSIRNRNENRLQGAEERNRFEPLAI